jgi:predicted DNA-binding transcriptional regulator YafY
MRADRLLSTLLLLQAHGRLSGRELADRLEVSARTVHRDMEALSAAGVPVFALRGSRGGWRLDEDWSTQVPALEESELRALLMAQPRVIGDTRMAAAAERAMSKLVAALPVPMRARAVLMRQRLYVDTTAWRGSTENVSQLPIVQEAVSRDRKLKMRYRKEGREVVDRVVDPLGLVAKGSTWYMVAFTPKGLRTFRVSRIEKATLLDQPVRRPADFDLAGFWKNSTEQFQQGWRRYETTLRLEPTAANWVTLCRVVAPAAKQPDSDGWVRLKIAFESEEEACFVVMGLGARVEVIEPVELREKQFAELNAALGVVSRRRSSRDPITAESQRSQKPHEGKS